MAPRVKSLFIHPIKSCKPIPVSEAVLTPTGFAWDRHWMVVSEASGRFMSQRTTPELCLIQPHLPDEALAEQDWRPLPPDMCLTVTTPTMPPLLVPLSSPLFSSVPVSVWKWYGEALDCGEDAAAWFSSFLDTPCRLVQFDTSRVVRPVDPSFAPGQVTAFADAYPFLLISKESLDELNARLAGEGQPPLDILRFRTNIYVENCHEPFEEDRWMEFSFFSNGENPETLQRSTQASNASADTVALSVERATAGAGAETARGEAGGTVAGIRTVAGVAGARGGAVGAKGGVTLRGVKHCGRCKITTTDQETAVVGEQPLKIFRSFRKGTQMNLPKPLQNELLFGMNVTYQNSNDVASARKIRVGDHIDVLQLAPTAAELLPV